MWKLTLGAAAAVGLAASGLVAADAQAQEDGVWWPAKVEIYSPSCTDGDPACWTDPANANLEVVDYVPLMANEVDAKHHICVSFPHLVDSYWVGAAYGIIEEGKRLGQKISLIEAGGYDKLEKQLSQVEDCIANGAEALVLSAISAEGNIKQVNELRGRGIPVVDLINGINTEVDAKSLESYYSMGRIACKWIADQHPEGSGKVKLAWFPGPPGASWSVAGNQGCHDAVVGTDAEIISTKWAQTSKEAQLSLVENVIQAQTSGDDVDLDYIVGVAPAVEGGMAALRDMGLQDEIKLVSYYYTPGMHQFRRPRQRRHGADRPDDHPGADLHRPGGPHPRGQALCDRRPARVQQHRPDDRACAAGGGTGDAGEPRGLRHLHDAGAQGLDARVQHRLSVKRLQR